MREASEITQGALSSIPFVAAGIISDAEAGTLREYDRKVMDILSVDDFAPHELGTQAEPAPQQTTPLRSSVHVA